jgi:hypothetical protein
VNYVYAGYAVTFVVLALYALRIALRGRALRRVLPPSVSPSVPPALASVPPILPSVPPVLPVLPPTDDR